MFFLLDIFTGEMIERGHSSVPSLPFIIKKFNFNRKKLKTKKRCTFTFEIGFFNNKRERGDG